MLKFSLHCSSWGHTDDLDKHIASAPFLAKSWWCQTYIIVQVCFWHLLVLLSSLLLLSSWSSLTVDGILSSFCFESSFLTTSFKPITQILTFILKPETCFKFLFVGLVINSYSASLKQSSSVSCYHWWHHHCTSHLPLTILKLLGLSMSSSMCTESWCKIPSHHDVCMCQELHVVWCCRWKKKNQDMVPDMKNLHSTRQTMKESAKCHNSSREKGLREPERSHVCHWGSGKSQENFHCPWRALEEKGARRAIDWSALWNDSFSSLGHSKTSYSPILPCFPISWN